MSDPETRELARAVAADPSDEVARECYRALLRRTGQDRLSPEMWAHLQAEGARIGYRITVARVPGLKHPYVLEKARMILIPLEWLPRDESA